VPCAEPEGGLEHVLCSGEAIYVGGGKDWWGNYRFFVSLPGEFHIPDWRAASRVSGRLSRGSNGWPCQQFPALHRRGGRGDPDVAMGAGACAPMPITRNTRVSVCRGMETGARRRNPNVAWCHQNYGSRASASELPTTIQTST